MAHCSDATFFHNGSIRKSSAHRYRFFLLQADPELAVQNCGSEAQITSGMSLYRNSIPHCNNDSRCRFFTSGKQLPFIIPYFLLRRERDLFQKYSLALSDLGRSRNSCAAFTSRLWPSNLGIGETRTALRITCSIAFTSAF